ncbi:MAG: flagellar basal body-associated FliL family protein [Tepidisphaerales bacterium]
MADKSDKAKGDAAEGEGKEKKAPLWTKTPVLIAGVMVIEAAALFAVFKLLGAGSAKATSAEVTLATGDAEHGSPAQQAPAMSEIPMLSERFPNVASGRRFLYDVAIVALVRNDNKAAVEELFKTRESMIKDRVRTIIAQSDPSKLGGGDEPGLETLRRQIKHQLTEIAGREGLIEEILIPRCIPFRVD